MFKNILILTNPAQVANIGQQAQDHLQVFQGAQKFLNDFIKANAKEHYADFFKVISNTPESGDLQGLVGHTQMSLKPEDQMQIKFWMLSALIKIVKSK